ncbi:MAG: cytochrome c oxidase assembly protein [Dehalococcoidia bacterium]
MLPLLHILGYQWLDWNFHLDVILLCLVMEAVYLYVVLYLRPVLSDAGRVRRTQALLFSLGVLTIYAASGSPLHDLADHYLMAAHMTQHLLLTMVAAPLLVAGTPGWMWQALLRQPGMMAVGRRITHPVMAIAIFNTALLMFHLPETIELQVEYWWFHLGAHIALVCAGLVLWWPILSQSPELPRVSYPLQMGYLFAQSLLPSVMASFVTFADSVVYSSYADAPRIWGISPIADQQIGGGIMKVGGSLILWAFIGVAFFKWFAQEEAEARGLPWGEVQAELDEMGLTARR